jgi:epoxide hydrolase
MTPFRITVSDAELADLRQRIGAARWPEPETVPDWSQGVPLEYLRDLCRYWADGYDWRATEARLNALPQFQAGVDGLSIHVARVRSPEPDAFPLVLTNGWPGSLAEYSKVAGPLTDPVRHGGAASDAFHLVLPALPGYGFSDKPSGPGWGVQRIAGAWAELMARLGYQRYGAHGSDWATASPPRSASRTPRMSPASTRCRRSCRPRRYTDIRYWNELDRGGHFPALEQPAAFVSELRAFFRLVR